MPANEPQPEYIRKLLSQGRPNIEAGDAYIKSLDSKMSLAEAREKIPALKGLDDETTFELIHKHYYPDLDRAELAKFLDYKLPESKVEKTEQTRGIDDIAIMPGQNSANLGSSSYYTTPETKHEISILGTSIVWILLIGGLFRYANLRGSQSANLNIIPQTLNNQIGIHGWLRFFIISLGIFGPALALSNISYNFHYLEATYVNLVNMPNWSTFKNTIWLIFGGFSAFNIHAALQLRFIWKPSSVTIAKIAIILWPCANILFFVLIPNLIFTEQIIPLNEKVIINFLISIISSVIWISYLSMSKLVQATYTVGHEEVISTTVVISNTTEINGQHEVPASAKVEVTLPVVSSQTDVPNTVIEPQIGEVLVDSRIASTEEELYEKIGSELDSGELHRPTWLKAFSQANGDEKIAKASYIKLRLIKLQKEELEKTENI